LEKCIAVVGVDAVRRIAGAGVVRKIVGVGEDRVGEVRKIVCVDVVGKSRRVEKECRRRRGGSVGEVRRNVCVDVVGKSRRKKCRPWQTESSRKSRRKEIPALANGIESKTLRMIL
jgi:hypothetical protein